MLAPALPIPDIAFDRGVPRSIAHDDIYFSAENGLAETQHVFLAANGLPERFAESTRFTIAETGFGTGLNFLAAWQAWHDAGEKGELVFISVEQSPLTPEQMREALHGIPLCSTKRDWLIESAPLRIPGWHHRECGKLRLVLGYGDAHALYSQLHAQVDAWFLDGFAPAKNPELWQPALFAEMARLSAKGATLASFTAAAAVLGGLAQAGFVIEKTKGFGHKRDMIRGQFTAGNAAAIPTAKTIAVIGAGIAGASTAHALATHGHHVQLYEAHAIAHGASGNQAGALYPNIGRRWNGNVAESFLAYAHMHWQLAQWKNNGLSFDNGHIGMLKLAKNADEKTRLESLQQTLGLDASIAQWLCADAASEKAGMPLPDGAAWFPHSGWLAPASLCHALLQHPNISPHMGHHITDFAALDEADAVVLACAWGAKALLPELRLNRSAGQLSMLDTTQMAQQPRTILCHKGYAVPQPNGLLIGATYDHDDLELHLRDDHHAKNIADCQQFLPGLLNAHAAARHGRIAHRVTTPDRVPIIGRIAHGHGVPIYGNLAHGSRGLLTAPYGAMRIAAEISGLPLDARRAGA